MIFKKKNLTTEYLQLALVADCQTGDFAPDFRLQILGFFVIMNTQRVEVSKRLKYFFYLRKGKKKRISNLFRHFSKNFSKF